MFPKLYLLLTIDGDDDSVNLGYKHLQDGPEKIELKQIQLAPNDIVVLATDGLWDNLHDSVITELASGLESSQSMLEDRCESLVLSARQHAIDSEFVVFIIKSWRDNETFNPVNPVNRLV